jgi:urease accessory protein
MTATGRLQRADGALELGYVAAGGATRLAHLFQSDPCRALFPRGETDDVDQTILLTTSGGLAGGDRIRMRTRCGADTRQVVTPQAAEKIYRAINAPTEIDVALEVEAGGWLEWVPQETILFDRSRLRRQVKIDVASGGAVLAGDILSFGRVAHGESYNEGALFDRWEVRRAGMLIWADRLRLDDPRAALAHPAGFAGARAYGTILHLGGDTSALLAQVRAVMATSQGRTAATVIGSLLLVRLLAATTAELRADYARIWTCLRQATAGLPPRMPRIWHS